MSLLCIFPLPFCLKLIYGLYKCWSQYIIIDWHQSIDNILLIYKQNINIINVTYIPINVSVNLYMYPVEL